MASARKKQDEKNLKTLRELVSLPHNKYCFDCNQRGPTYVNVTIGSFVCTKCSGMLRGLTPPHRVKSISMATFTQEEVELVQNRGNDYCRRTWLGLYEGAPLSDTRVEQQIHDLMVDKYERRRYYMDQPVSSGTSHHNNTSSNNLLNSSSSNNSSNRANGGLLSTSTTSSSISSSKPSALIGGTIHLNSDLNKQSPLRLMNGVSNGVNIRMRNNGITISRPVVSSMQKTTTNVAVTNANNATDFVANFDSADIFNAANNNNNNNNCNMSNGFIISNGAQSGNQQPSFANFDNNPVFTNTNPFRLSNLQENGSYQTDWTSFFDSDDTFDYSNDYVCVQNTNKVNQQKITASVPPAPPEDRYAALKDLDNALKNQSTTLDWNSGSSNGSLYSSPTPAGSIYSSSSPQSLYGSPSQGQFISIFSQQETASNTSNPFNNSGQLWGNSSTTGTTTTSLVNGMNGMTNGSSPNPFRVTPAVATAAVALSDPFKMNGFSQSFQQSAFATAAPVPINGSAWTPNPFKVTTNGHSNNPFL